VAHTAAVVGQLDLTEAVVGARSAGVLKRLRGTPLPFRWYVAGRVCATLITALLACAVLAAAGICFLGVSVVAGGVPALLLALGAGSLCFSSLGLALAALLPSAHSLVAVTLGTLPPLCFISEIFVVGDQPLPGPLAASPRRRRSSGCSSAPKRITYAAPSSQSAPASRPSEPDRWWASHPRPDRGPAYLPEGYTSVQSTISLVNLSYDCIGDGGDGTSSR
jgi:hypothetical protein